MCVIPKTVIEWVKSCLGQVINIINTAQENSPSTVVQALDRVLDILRSSELYNPAQVKEDDQMTTDLVGGLMAVSPARPMPPIGLILSF